MPRPHWDAMVLREEEKIAHARYRKISLNERKILRNIKRVNHLEIFTFPNERKHIYLMCMLTFMNKWNFHMCKSFFTHFFILVGVHLPLKSTCHCAYHNLSRILCLFLSTFHFILILIKVYSQSNAFAKSNGKSF